MRRQKEEAEEEKKKKENPVHPTVECGCGQRQVDRRAAAPANRRSRQRLHAKVHPWRAGVKRREHAIDRQLKRQLGSTDSAGTWKGMGLPPGLTSRLVDHRVRRPHYQRGGGATTVLLIQAGPIATKMIDHNCNVFSSINFSCSHAVNLQTSGAVASSPETPSEPTSPQFWECTAANNRFMAWPGRERLKGHQWVSRHHRECTDEDTLQAPGT